MASYLLTPPSGVAGDITKVDETLVESIMLVAQSGVYAQAYGIPVKYVSGGIAQFTGSEAATAFAGVLVREVPFQDNSLSEGFSNCVPNPQHPQGFTRRGFINVICAAGTPVRGGSVYVQVTADAVAVGAFRADGTDSGNAVLLTNAFWAVDGMDANNNAELQINIAG